MWHKSLFATIHHNGIQRLDVGWIQDFLTSWTRVVVVDSEESKTTTVTFGVPQGLVLGLALFLIYINHLTERLHSTPRLFTDDCLLYRIIEIAADWPAAEGPTHTWECRRRTGSWSLPQRSAWWSKKMKYKIHDYVLDLVDRGIPSRKTS